MKKAVAVGGSGFIGFHVADCLSDDGYQVTIYDFVKSLWFRESQEMVIGDILDDKALKQVIKGADVVYNFAGLANLDHALNQPINSAKINILGNLNVLEACRILNVKRIIYASTIYVYQGLLQVITDLDNYKT
jgi:UDP-glucose 4-epimerase